ncbi:MAG: pentapeptide repeat-containing protein [Desmonostoc vinosum HA7617-LM4]|jgi:hypothetical protein|nr:pentapeptide repeat-containing protein [Desmonostoc vinosum HA7617-LM4]
MNFSIRHWLAERYIEINQIKGFSAGQLAGIAYRIVQDMEVKSLVPFDICTLVEVLEMPLSIVLTEIDVMTQLTGNLLRSFSQKKPLKRNEGTWLAFQIAYLKALQEVLAQEESLQKPWLDLAKIPNQSRVLQEQIGKFTLQDSQLQGLLKTLSPGKLTDTQAEQALSLVADSLLVQQLNNAAVAWLVANGTEEPEAKLLIQRLSHSLPGNILLVVTENAAALAQLQKFVRLGVSFSSSVTTSETGLSATPSGSTVGEKIDLYREYYRASLIQNLSMPLFMESFALKDIYVPLTGLPKEESSLEQERKIAKSVDLREWVQQQLADLETIAVIESEPGYGKTSFCQIWAAQVAQELYPTWMPILIRLRDITYGKTLAQTLNSAFPLNSHTNLATWLEQDHPRCLLLLDGLDELPPSRHGTREKIIFIQQLLHFQSQRRHKIVLTSRLMTLQEIIPELPLLLRRITIQPLEVGEFKQWFQQWATVQSLPIAQSFFTFLKQAGLFNHKSNLPELSVLIRQPLMLYLLGILHRDGLLDNEILLFANTQQTNSTPLVWEIYDRLNRWLVGYPSTSGIKTTLLRSGSAHIHRTPEAIANLLAGRHPQDLLEQMQAIALKILHSQRHQLNQPTESNVDSLPTFYFKNPHKQKTLPHSPFPTEFSHPKLGKYFCAKAVAMQLQLLTQSQEDAYGTFKFILDSPSSVAQHLYNLLGYGILSPEIEELVLEGLRREQKHKFSFEVLFQRLLFFWRAYCQSRWLDEGVAHKALTYFQSLQNPVNIEQVNAAVGMNVFLLLCACHREVKVPFWPCGNPASLTEFHPEALSALIGRTTVLHKNAFAMRMRSKSLAGINLCGVSLLQVGLNRVNLEQANLSNAELMGANLAGANLQQANLAGANLHQANLTGANLQQANLTGANLHQANLMGVNLNLANLTNACLFEAILAEVDQEFAIANGALFSLEQFQNLQHLPPPLSNMFKTMQKTDVNWKGTSEMRLIESAEGVPVLPLDLDDGADDETVFGNHSTDNINRY